MKNKKDDTELVLKAIENTQKQTKVREDALKIMRNPDLTDKEKLDQVQSIISTDDPNEILDDGGVFAQIERLKSQTK